MSQDPNQPDSDDDTFDLADDEPGSPAPESAGVGNAYAADMAGPSAPPPPDPDKAPAEVDRGKPSIAAGWDDPANQPPPQDPATAARRREDSRKEAALRMAEDDAKARKVKLIVIGVLVVVGIILWKFVF